MQNEDVLRFEKIALISCQISYSQLCRKLSTITNSPFTLFRSQTRRIPVTIIDQNEIISEAFIFRELDGVTRLGIRGYGSSMFKCASGGERIGASHEDEAGGFHHGWMVVVVVVVLLS